MSVFGSAYVSMAKRKEKAKVPESCLRCLGLGYDSDNSTIFLIPACCMLYETDFDYSRNILEIDIYALSFAFSIQFFDHTVVGNKLHILL